MATTKFTTHKFNRLSTILEEWLWDNSLHLNEVNLYNFEDKKYALHSIQYDWLKRFKQIWIKYLGDEK